MKKNLLYIILIFFSACSNNKSQKNIAYTLDNPLERVVWERLKLMDPTTGEIPKDIRKKELIFSKTIPSTNLLSKSNWVHRGPYNVGGRTRALAIDILDEDILLAGGASGGMFRSVDGGQNWEMTTKSQKQYYV